MTHRVQAAIPRDIAGIGALLEGFDGNISYVAGATDLIIAREHCPPPDLLIDISGVEDMGFIKMSGENIRIGAATTLATVAQHPGLMGRLPVLTQAALQVGSEQIRNRATIGGNIASAVPAGDLLPALRCLNARIEVRDRTGASTTFEFEDVVIGSGETCLGNGDLITDICIPISWGRNTVSAFEKIGRRSTLTIASLSLAAIADYDQSKKRIVDIRVVAGAIGPVPLRLHAVEQVLRTRIVDQSLANDFLHALVATVDAVIPGRYSLPYKRHAIAGLGLDLLHRLFGTTFEPPPTLRALT